MEKRTLKIEIRREQEGDAESVRQVNDEAFGQPVEGSIIDALRRSCKDLLSLVAVAEGSIVGHILFSPVVIERQKSSVKGMGLAPMAVLPAYQRRGVGSQLVRTGIRILKEAACPFIIVLGHVEYYPRFGFSKASAHGITCQWEGIPDEAFMILALDELALHGVSGVARYREEFNEAV